MSETNGATRTEVPEPHRSMSYPHLAGDSSRRVNKKLLRASRKLKALPSIVLAAALWNLLRHREAYQQRVLSDYRNHLADRLDEQEVLEELAKQRGERAS